MRGTPWFETMRSVMSDERSSFDVVIVGGAVIGSAAAYFLMREAAEAGLPAPSVVVVERDPTYQTCSTALSAASIRQQFSTPENIAISQFGIAFLRDLGRHLAVEGEAPEIGLQEGGYLLLATDDGRPILESNHRTQTAAGADIAVLGPDGLRERFPWLSLDGLSAGAFGRSGEGWFDAYGLMMGLRRKARAMGVDYRHATVTGFEMAGTRIAAVRLDDGRRITAGTVINAAGPRARAVAAMAGLEIPVHPRKRCVFSFECRDRLAGFPLLVDPAGVWVRPEGEGFIAGCPPPADQDPDCLDHEVDWPLFEETMWPILANRVPAFEAIKPGRAWAGHYEMNLFDHNALIGAARERPNLLLANGFSGHGLQQAPAVGRALAELVLHGGYRSLDLSIFSPDRIADHRPVRELNVI